MARGSDERPWFKPIVQTHHIALFLAFEFIIIAAGLGYFQHYEEVHQAEDNAAITRTVQLNLSILKAISNEFNTHAQASANRSCASAALARYIGGLSVNLTKHEHERLMSYVQTACSYTLPGGRSSTCPVPPKDQGAAGATSAIAAGAAGDAVQTLADALNGRGKANMERAFIFHRVGSDHSSSKIALGSVDDALDARMDGGGGPYRIGRYRLGKLIDPGPWRTQGDAVDAFTGRLREGHVGAIFMIESQSRKDWGYKVRVVEWTLGEQVIALAKTWLGIKYVWAAENPPGTQGGPGAAFDCSGLTAAAWAAFGVTLPHNAEAQRQLCTKVNKPQPGDLVMFDFETADGVSAASHVGLWLKPGYTLDTRSPDGEPVGIRPIEGQPYFMGFYRPPGIK